MKPIERGEILGLADYEAVRDAFRGRVIAEKKLRRVALGPKATALFENRDTVLLQVQEMLRTERITRPAAIQHEIDTYNENLPTGDELSCTVMIEIPDATDREAFLQAAKGFERHLWLAVDGERSRARGSDRGDDTSRTTAVHYLKLPLSPKQASSLRGVASGRLPKVEIGVDHPVYEASTMLPEPSRCARSPKTSTDHSDDGVALEVHTEPLVSPQPRDHEEAEGEESHAAPLRRGQPLRTEGRRPGCRARAQVVHREADGRVGQGRHDQVRSPPAPCASR